MVTLYFNIGDNWCVHK